MERKENRKLTILAVCLLTAAFLTAVGVRFAQSVPRGTQTYTVTTQYTTDRDLAPKRPQIAVNTASAEELMRLPGVGEKLAAEIIAEREANGPFASPEDLLRVKGIGEKKLAGFAAELVWDEEAKP